MLLKKSIRFVSYVLAFIGFGGIQTSCKDDDDGELCYRCTWSYTYNSTTYTNSETICQTDYIENRGATKQDFLDYIDYLKVEYTATCTKKSLQ